MSQKVEALTRIQFFLIRTSVDNQPPKDTVLVRVGSETTFQDYIDPSGGEWLKKLIAAPEWASQALTRGLNGTHPKTEVPLAAGVAGAL